MAPPRQRIEWSFAAGTVNAGPAWDTRGGVSGLTVAEGGLAGRSTTAFPIVHVAREADPADDDPLYAVEVRARVSAGANLSVQFAGETEPPLPQLEGEFDLFPWGRSPLTPGDQFVTYTMTSPNFLSGSGIRHVFIRPTDVAGADFAIESVRLVFRSEQLAAIESGVSWQGLGEVYHETLVSRAPESIRFGALALPREGWLDLSVGTIEGQPVTFRVSLEAGGETTQLLERTVTTPNAWQPVALDLAKWGGRDATFALALDSGAEGTIGLWGSPAIRRRGPPSTNTELARLAGKDIEPPLGVILIMMDTLRADHLSAWGYERETTPTLQSMADRGVRFVDNLSQAHLDQGGDAVIDDVALSVGAHGRGVLRPTAGVGDHAGGGVPRRGLLDSVACLRCSSPVSSATCTRGSKSCTSRLRCLPSRRRTRPRPAAPISTACCPGSTAIARARSSSTSTPPTPTTRSSRASRSLSAGSNAAAGRELLADQAKVAKVIESPLMRLFMMPSRAELEKAQVDPKTYIEREIGWYDGSILGFDVELKRLLERLRELGLERRTLIAFVGDHGEEFLEHGATFHGQSVYGELTHVPMLLYWPGTLPEGLAIEQTVETIDLMPTLLQLAGLTAPAGISGAEPGSIGGGARRGRRRLTGWLASPSRGGGEGRHPRAPAAATCRAPRSRHTRS